MSRPHKIGCILVFLCFATVFFVFSLPKAEAAASIYVAPTSGTFTLGSTFTVSIYVNTGGQAINAVEVNLSFPPDKLQVVSPTTGKSFIQVWVTQPSYSNLDGTIKFQGTIPTPGINTEAGLISTLTFRVKNIGTAVLKVLDNSKVLLNDGRGTNVLGQTTSGIYNLTFPPPQGPTVTSKTNPDQEKWYNNTRAVSFKWNAPQDIEGYSYILDQDPAGEPDGISEGVQTRVVYNNLADGVYYFHIKSLRQGSWGGVTDYVVRIDNTPPAVFKINFSPSDSTSNHRPIIDFATTDATAGIDRYELKLIPLDPPTALVGQNNTPFFIEVSSPYSRVLDEGKYDVVVRAYDRAGNYYQAESRLTIAKPFLDIIGVSALPWPVVGILAAILLGLLVYLANWIWKRHRQIEEYLIHGVLRHPSVSGKLKEFKEKQKEYGGGKGLIVILLLLTLGFGVFAREPAKAAQDPRTHLENISARDMSQFSQDQGATTKVYSLYSEEEPTQVLRKLAISRMGCGDFPVPLRCGFVAVAGATASLPRLADTGKSLATRAGDIFEVGSSNVRLEPPVVTLFPKSVSNDEILYIGGHAGAPQAQVLIYLQNIGTGSTLNQVAVTDKDGAWFYSFPQFLEAGHYIAWTQFKVANEVSPPSSKLDLFVAPTAIQIGNLRLNYEDFYLILLIIFAVAFFGLLTFVIYHGYHFRKKNRRLNQAIKEAEDSIRRGFAVLRRDIEAELDLIRRAKLRKELSAEEKLREEKLLKDFEAIGRYISKEVWEIGGTAEK